MGSVISVVKRILDILPTPLIEVSIKVANSIKNLFLIIGLQHCGFATAFAGRFGAVKIYTVTSLTIAHPRPIHILCLSLILIQCYPVTYRLHDSVTTPRQRKWGRGQSVNFLTTLPSISRRDFFMTD